MVIVLLAGCGIDTAKRDAWVARQYEDKYGGSAEVERRIEYNKKMSESHRMMAAMILKNAGMDPDLDSYKEVYLYVVKSGGEEHAVVFVNGELIIP
jgi:hypothetical protein